MRSHWCGSRIRWCTLSRHRTADRVVVMLKAACKGHYSLESGLLFLRVLPSLLFCLLASCLAWRTCLQLSRDALQVVRHLGVGLQEEQLKIPRLVFELNLCPILQNIGYAAVSTEQRQDLTPMRAFDHVQPSHKSLFFFRCPSPASGVDPLAAGCRRGLCNCRLPGSLVKYRCGECLVRRKTAPISRRRRRWRELPIGVVWLLGQVIILR